MVKTCTKCSRELTIDNFSKKKSNKDGLQKWCKDCCKTYSNKYCNKQVNRDKKIEYDKTYRNDNKPKISEVKKIWWGLNRETIIIRNKKEYKNNPMIREKCKIQNIHWLSNNKDKVRLRCKIYNQSHHEQRNMSNERRRTMKQLLPHTLTLIQWTNIKATFDNRCAYCGRELPLQQEHFIALSKGGEYTLNNIIPSCGSCNSSKRDKDFDIWYHQYRYYSKKRETVILKYLGYNNNEQQLKISI